MQKVQKYRVSQKIITKWTDINFTKVLLNDLEIPRLNQLHESVFDEANMIELLQIYCNIIMRKQQLWWVLLFTTIESRESMLTTTWKVY